MPKMPYRMPAPALPTKSDGEQVKPANNAWPPAVLPEDSQDVDARNHGRSATIPWPQPAPGVGHKPFKTNK